MEELRWIKQTKTIWIQPWRLSKPVWIVSIRPIYPVNYKFCTQRQNRTNSIQEALRGWLKNVLRFLSNTPEESINLLVSFENPRRSTSVRKCQCYTVPLDGEKQDGSWKIVLDTTKCHIHRKQRHGSTTTLKRTQSCSMNLETKKTKDPSSSSSSRCSMGGPSKRHKKEASVGSTLVKLNTSSSQATITPPSGTQMKTQLLCSEELPTYTNWWERKKSLSKKKSNPKKNPLTMLPTPTNINLLPHPQVHSPSSKKLIIDLTEEKNGPPKTN